MLKRKDAPGRQPVAQKPAPRHPLRPSSQVPSQYRQQRSLHRRSDRTKLEWFCLCFHLTVLRAMLSLRVGCYVKVIQRVFKGCWKPWKFWSQLRIAAESGERVPITSYISVPTTRSVRVSDWRSVGGAICRRFDVDDHPPSGSEGVRGEC